MSADTKDVKADTPDTPSSNEQLPQTIQEFQSTDQMAAVVQLDLVVMYHFPCIDGSMSAAIALQMWPKAILHQLTVENIARPWLGLGSQTAFNQLFANRCILIVDITPSTANLEALLVVAVQVTVLDHHVLHGKELLAVATNRKFQFRLATDLSGAGLVWNYCFTNQMPVIVQWIQMHDLYGPSAPDDVVFAAIAMHEQEKNPQVFAQWLYWTDPADKCKSLANHGRDLWLANRSAVVRVLKKFETAEFSCSGSSELPAVDEKKETSGASTKDHKANETETKETERKETEKKETKTKETKTKETKTKETKDHKRNGKASKAQQTEPGVEACSAPLIAYITGVKSAFIGPALNEIWRMGILKDKRIQCIAFVSFDAKQKRKNFSLRRAHQQTDFDLKTSIVDRYLSKYHQTASGGGHAAACAIQTADSEVRFL